MLSLSSRAPGDNNDGPMAPLNLRQHFNWQDNYDADNFRRNNRSTLSWVQHHNCDERKWYICLSNLFKAPLDSRDTLPHLPQPPGPPGTLAVDLGSEMSLWHASLSDESTFRDTPMQKALVDMVLFRKHGQTYTPEQRDSKRSTIGAHIPDFTSTLSYSRAPQPTLTIISSVGELEITQLVQTRTGDPRVRTDNEGDPELQDDDLRSSTGSGDLERILAVDGHEKWKTGLAKAVIYLQSANEYCGTFLGLVSIRSQFSRMIMPSSRHILLECSQAFLQRMTAATSSQPDASDSSSRLSTLCPTLPLANLLEDVAGHTHLALTIDDGNPVVGWNETTIGQLLDFHKASFAVLARHSLGHDSFTRLQPLTSYAGVADIIAEVTAAACDNSLDVDDRTGVLDASRPQPNEPGQPGKRPFTGQDERTTAAKKRKGENAGERPVTLPKNNTVSQSTGYSHMGTPRDEEAPTVANKVDRWRSSLPLIEADCDETRGNSFEVITPAGSDDPTVVIASGDPEFDDVLEASDMRPIEDLLREFVEPDSDWDDDDEESEPTPRVLLQDMLQVLAKYDITVTLVDSVYMDRLIAAISAA